MDDVTDEDRGGRLDWLRRAQADLSERLEQRFGPDGALAPQGDPLYQRMWYALKRLQDEVQRVSGAIAAGQRRRIGTVAPAESQVTMHSRGPRAACADASASSA
jgi:hypothetical protein